MITKMTGQLVRLLDDEIRLQVGPFEYQLLIPEAIRWQVQARMGQDITFHILEYWEGNSGGNRFVPRRLGFLSEVEVEFFELFCTVDKIGAKKALKAMARPVRDIAAAIVRQDSKWLSTLPGIGLTTAETIVSTLKRKVEAFTKLPASESSPAETPAEEPKTRSIRGKKATSETVAVAEPEPTVMTSTLAEEAYLALMAMGMTPAEARSKVDALLTSGKKFTNIQEAITLMYARNG